MSFEEKRVHLNPSAIPSGVPIGTLIWWFGKIEAIPEGWMICDGSRISDECRELYEIMDSWYLPDLITDNRFIRASKVAGVVQGDAIRNITGSAGAVLQVGNQSGAFYYGGFVGNYGSSHNYGYNWSYFDASLVVPTAEENRPKNISALPLMKVK